MSKPMILLAIDGREDRSALATQLGAANIACQCVDQPTDLLAQLEQSQPATVIVDISFGGRNAHHLLRSSALQLNGTPVVFRAHRSATELELALEASLRGAGDFLLAPHDHQQLGPIIERARCYFEEQRSANETIAPLANGVLVERGTIPHERRPSRSGRGPARSVGCAGNSPAAAEFDPARDLTPLQRQERLLIIDALAQTEDNVVDAARMLKMGQATIYRKIRMYQISHARRRRKRV